MPAWPLIADFWHDERYYPELMHESGVFSVQLLVVSLLITPVNQFLKSYKSGIPVARWLLKRRRNIGVASFAYAMLHLLFYIRELGEFGLIVLDLADVEIAVGWLGMVILFVLAVTSNDWSVRKLLARWKKLHFWTYPAAGFIFLHWYLYDSFPYQLLTWLIPLLLIRDSFLIFQLWRKH